MKLSEEQIEYYTTRLSSLVDQTIESNNPPFAALLLNDKGEVVIEAKNRTAETNDPTAHAEILLLREAAQKYNRHTFENWGIFVNSEPCTMCMSAMLRARINNYYWGPDKESHSEPKISAHNLAKTTDFSVSITTGVNKETFSQQIQRARMK